MVRRRSAPLTKLVTTIGPSSEEFEPLQKIVASGMSVMRLNFSHATPDEFFLRMNNLAKAEGGQYVAALLDTRGPEIRMGGLKICQDNRKAKVELKEGETLILTTDPSVDGLGDEKKMFINYEKLTEKVEKGTQILLDDGSVVVEVQNVDKEVTTTIQNTGLLGERKGVNLPGIPLELPAMSKKDEADILFGVEHGIDIVAASFVHDAAGVNTIRQYIHQCAEKFPAQYPTGPSEYPTVIAKIESVEALRNLHDIIDAADGIMVARGDLGVEIPIVEVCQVQKDIISACRDRGKPVIVATQMLDSMSKNPRPTRAEVADNTNAVIDRADALMLSGESANGDYPVLSVQTQLDIARTTEAWLHESSSPAPLSSRWIGSDRGDNAHAAVSMARQHQARAIVALDLSDGSLAKRIAAAFPEVPVLALVASPRIARQLNLFRAVVPLVASPDDVKHLSLPELSHAQLHDVARLARDSLNLSNTDPIVVVGTSGYPTSL